VNRRKPAASRLFHARGIFKMPVPSCAARRQGIACVRKVTMQLPNRPRMKPIAAVALLEATTGGVGSK
jgi:hypothetical protein